jgi:hypothetical protein
VRPAAGSFIPPAEIAKLRDLTRYRSKIIGERVRETQRVQKLLEDAGIKLDSVVTDVLGVSGRRMLEALIAGERDPDVLAEMALARMRSKIGTLRSPRGAIRRPSRLAVADAPRPHRRTRRDGSPPRR